MFNLLGLFRLASIGKRIGMDLWHYETSQGAGLQTALDYLLPYALKKQDWPYSQTASIKYIEASGVVVSSYYTFQEQ